jgi:hypothetical protein
MVQQMLGGTYCEPGTVLDSETVEEIENLCGIQEKKLSLIKGILT